MTHGAHVIHVIGLRWRIGPGVALLVWHCIECGHGGTADTPAQATDAGMHHRLNDCSSTYAHHDQPGRPCHD